MRLNDWYIMKYEPKMNSVYIGLCLYAAMEEMFYFLYPQLHSCWYKFQRFANDEIMEECQNGV